MVLQFGKTTSHTGNRYFGNPAPLPLPLKSIFQYFSSSGTLLAFNWFVCKCRLFVRVAQKIFTLLFVYQVEPRPPSLPKSILCCSGSDPVPVNWNQYSAALGPLLWFVCLQPVKTSLATLSIFNHTIFVWLLLILVWLYHHFT